MYLLVRVNFSVLVNDSFGETDSNLFSAEISFQEKPRSQDPPYRTSNADPLPKPQKQTKHMEQGPSGRESPHRTAEEAWISKQKVQNGKPESSVQNSSLNWKTNLWLAEEAEIEIGHMEKWFVLLENVIHVVAGTEEYQKKATIGYGTTYLWTKGKCWKEKCCLVNYWKVKRKHMRNMAKELKNNAEKGNRNMLKASWLNWKLLLC